MGILILFNARFLSGRRPNAASYVKKLRQTVYHAPIPLNIFALVQRKVTIVMNSKVQKYGIIKVEMLGVIAK